MKAKPKVINRIFSFICLGVFFVSIIIMGFGIYHVTKLYHENQNLSSIKENLQTQTQYQNQYEAYHFDEYYSVYVEDGYALYNDGENEPLIYFTK